MSNIPKYIIKRMIPKDGVKLIGNELVFTVVNVLSPWTIDEVPDDVLNYLAAKVDNISQDLSKGFSIKTEEKTYTLKNVKEALGSTFPVGGIMTLTLPNHMKLTKGSTHTFDITIKLNNPIQIQFEREIC